MKIRSSNEIKKQILILLNRQPMSVTHLRHEMRTGPTTVWKAIRELKEEGKILEIKAPHRQIYMGKKLIEKLYRETQALQG